MLNIRKKEKVEQRIIRVKMTLKDIGRRGSKFVAEGDLKSARGINFERNRDHCEEGVLRTG